MSQSSSIFSDEERTITEAEELLRQCGESLPAAAFAELLRNYKKLYRQSVRLVKMGDRMQGQLNRLNEQLAKSEEKYRSIFESSIQGIFRATPHGPFLDLNPAMSSIFSYNAPQEMLQTISDFVGALFPAPEQGDRFLQELRVKGVLKEHSLQLRKRNGELVWVEVSTRGVFSATGELVELEGLVVDVTEKRRMLHKLETLARCDELTGLWNRRYFFELGQRELARARRENTPLSLIFFDIDHFKRINDTYGHETGDIVLQELAVLCHSQLRKLDILGRIGGEEFAVLLPGTPLAGALQVAEKIRGSFESSRIEARQVSLKATASFGIAQLSPESPCLTSLLSMADKALYDAKRGGRNCVTSTCPCLRTP